jgi:rhamnogalacturonyl hydrolase YesR
MWMNEGGDSRVRNCVAYLWGLLVVSCLAAPVALGAEPVVLNGDTVRITISAEGTTYRELVEIRDGSVWAAALDTQESVTQVRVAGKTLGCTSLGASVVGKGIVTRGECSNGTFERELQLSPSEDKIAVKVRFTPHAGATVSSVEDRMSFAPKRHKFDTPFQGPLDFVWSQDIKASQDDLVAHWAFKSPTVIFQQAHVLAAIVPRVDLLSADGLRKAPPALDLDVTSGEHAWFSYGVVPSKPTGHSYFLRDNDAALDVFAGPIEYQYWILASAQPEFLGYRKVSQFLWEQFGSPALKQSMDLQRNVRRPELLLFDDWRSEAWTRYANEKYWEKDCGGARCGGLTSNRNPWGVWDEAPKDDAWFNSWFQNLRTAYGWYLYAQRTNNPEMMRQAEQVLNLALSSPRHNGAFSIIYLHDTDTWFRDDGWAGFVDDYHTFCMSWTGYWMLRWAEDLVPARKAEILAFLRPYADLLLNVQQASGCIPSWLDENLKPRGEFRDFNAETAGSALFLAQFSEAGGDAKYLSAAIRAQDFITTDVLPRQRWFDFETFLSCARKPMAFYDNWTAQYPQNNLSQIQAAQAYFEIYRLTGQEQYLEKGAQIVDYLLLTQQVWNHPLLSPKVLGGTTTQNTDAEWSDARQCYVASLLLDYYKATGRMDYLERAVAAARSGFAVAPWENWAHTGYIDEEGSLTGFHWGTGSEMASVEMMSGFLGDVFVNVERRQGVGFNACTVDDLQISGTTIAIALRAEQPPKQSPQPDRRLLVRFAGIDRNANYKIIVNGGQPESVDGEELQSQGLWISLKPAN